MGSDSFILLGVNHKTTPVEIREEIALTNGYDEPLRRLAALDGCRECFLLSTCNRVELLVVGQYSEDLVERLLRFLFGADRPLTDCRSYTYLYTGIEAVRHLFAVAASLDSLVVGEAQILGQIKEAYRFASVARSTGPLLNRLLHKTFSMAKRIRTETGIGSSAVSISSAAVELARKIFGELHDKRVLLVGAGEMAELAALHLVGQGVASVTVVNRTLARGGELARRFAGRAVSFDELVTQLEQADIIISSTSATGVILKKAEVKPVMRLRRNKPLFFIDIAVPRDLDPALNDLENVYLYDIDDLGQVVEMNRSERDREAIKAKRIVEEETIKFQHWLGSMAVTPTILDLRSRADEICRQELAKTLSRMNGLSDGERRSVEKMAAAITAKLLHNPLQYLKDDDCGGRDNTRLKVDTVRNVFGLDKGDRP
ncbi:MAG: glutamyl-tRNA reductase [Desulfopila sp.]